MKDFKRTLGIMLTLMEVHRRSRSVKSSPVGVRLMILSPRGHQPRHPCKDIRHVACWGVHDNWICLVFPCVVDDHQDYAFGEFKVYGSVSSVSDFLVRFIISVTSLYC